ncbi:MAG TPA: arabinofuranosidase catalytic domain-containing protein [Polyangiaceae bacterium]|nr:arabinofuranosidase catalytic domain-containing protein [Polyangiaceae bacterium]
MSGTAGSAQPTSGSGGAGVLPGGSGGSGGAGGGQSGSGGASVGGGGGSGGSGGMSANTTGPCDIYGAANNACVAAYSTVRRLLSTYAGPIYQVRKGGPSPNTGSGGMTQDIMILANGFADAAAHTAFCAGATCTFSKLYDQSGSGNDLTVAKRGCYGCSEPMEQCSSCTDSACEDDYETDASETITVGGNTVYTLHMDEHEGYRDNGTAWPTNSPPAAGMPVGNPAAGQGVYMVAEGYGKRPDAASACCWNFGNVSTNNCYGPSGQMNALMLGNAFWGSGAGEGPWFMGDFEAGVWAGGINGDITNGGYDRNMMLPSMTMDYAFGILKTQPNNYAIRVADATTGMLTTAYDGAAPTVFAGDGQWQMAGGIALGLGGDNSNHASGTFLEGAITASRPTDATDAAVHENVKALRYGQ